MSKPSTLPPPHPREAERLALLRRLAADDGLPESGLDALVACAARLTGSPVALISLIGEDRQWVRAGHGYNGPPLPREHAFCAHAILQDGLFEVPDTHLDARFVDNPLVAGAPHVRFYAGQSQLVDGLPMGTLCVIDVAPRTLTDADRDALAQLSFAATELLQSRQRLLEAERQRARLLDFARAAGDWMWESDAEHRHLWLSDSFETLTGLAPGPLIGQPISDRELLDEQGRPQPGAPRYREVLARQAAFSRVLTVTDTPRGALAISRSAVPVLDAAGRFAGYRGTARDVTATLAAEAEARRGAALLGQLAAQVPGVLFAYRRVPEGNPYYTYVSDGITALSGLRPEQLLADATLFWHQVHPDDLDVLVAKIADATARQVQMHGVFRLHHTDGTLRWVETRAAPTLQPDGSTLWHGFTADITERRATEAALRDHEERWQLAAAAAGIGIAQLTLADGLVHLDARACANHGLVHPQPQFTLTDWVTQIDPQDRDAAALGVQQTLQSSAPFEGRYRIHRPDGSVRWLEFVVRATLDADGQPSGVIGTCRDVHEQQTAAELQRQKQEAERASQAKSEFLSRVSHELRTPLNAILGFAQLMALDRGQPLAGEQGRRLANVQRAGRHLLGLISDVLDLSRIQRADFALPAVPVDLDAALRASLALVRPLADDRRIRFARESLVGAWALGDARAIEQVLMNLLSNAIKYSPPGAVVALDLVRDGDTLLLSVRDRGAGLSAAQQAQLFQPFERLGAEAQRIEGTGLGLVIARQLVEAMGGRIEVASQPGVGSSFGIRLAACAAPAPSPEATVAALAAPAVAPRGIAPPRRREVLYIEDELLNQLLLKEMFRARPDWRLQVASDGASGLALLRARRPDLLLVDMNLPDTTGLALLRTLRADSGLAGLPCIAVSADALPAQIDAARAAGFDDYWTKPIDVAQVLGRLDALLDPAA